MSGPTLRSKLGHAGVVFGMTLAVRADAANGRAVTLISPGEAPRKQVRLAPVVGSTERVTVEGESTATFSMQPMPNPGPQHGTSHTIFDLRPTAVDADGAITATLEVIAVVQVGGPRGRRERSALVGATGTLTLTSGGAITDVELAPGDLDDAEDASLVEAARRMTTPFPREPIGPGAVWTVEDVLDLAVLRVALVTTCRLVSVEDGVATITSKTVSSDGTELSLADVGVKAKLTELTLRGTSTWTQPLNAIAPSQHTAQGRYEIAVKGRKGLIPFKLHLETDAITRASSAPPA